MSPGEHDDHREEEQKERDDEVGEHGREGVLVHRKIDELHDGPRGDEVNPRQVRDATGEQATAHVVGRLLLTAVYA